MKIAAAILAISVSGCSFVLTSSPKPPPAPPDCSESHGMPIVDILGAMIVAPMLGLVAWGISKDADKDTEDAMIGGTIGISMLAFTTSAIVGFVRVSRCKDAQDAYRGEMMIRGAQPQPYAPPVYAPPPVAEPPAGSERGFCRPDGTCDAGLVCASNRCVVLPTN